ncbi:glycogen/starch/alpha-glucan phosphorylase [Anaeroselena agilis]|uniref:Alpha-1,4 glucan phosphorylase n=1 Tax=Anaeroselena agilis TaxID=3063788 RepID=A0ABU3P347_9FIRM|nr:glycogen/starch/alpha-glucan phosphorylase [Selenomonadales bacterium 4137-cl]
MLREKEEFKAAFIERLQALHGKSLEEASAQNKYAALGSLVRDYIGKRWVNTNKQYVAKGEKQVYYFSIEFLLGRLLDTYLRGMGVRDVWVEALAELGVDYAELEDQEHDAGLGNGGLGRLAACFLDSLAALELPGHGCGIRYKYGLFEQKIIDGDQVEHPDNWLKNGNIWEYRKIDKAVRVEFGGSFGAVLAVPYDIPILGFGNNTVNTLRLWSAEPTEGEMDFASFNQGNYLKAVEYKYSVEAISEILYPDDTHYEGRLLRLKQQYFLVSAGIQSILRTLRRKHGDIRLLPEKVAIHINDTHPALAVPELMRILMDEEGLGWDEAWQLTTGTISYTNHTIMPEALEKWPIDIFQSLLPRLWEIVHEINERFCHDLWHFYPGDWDRIAAMAITADGFVKMAHLAVAGSHSVNGVAKIHTEILKKDCMKLFYQYTPYKFNNKTNGITHRRWLMKANPGLASLITDTIGPSWMRHPTDLNRLQYFVADAPFQERLAAIKRDRKAALARFVKAKYELDLDPESIFDTQVKRIHVYKRQLLNALRIMELYNRLKENPRLDIVPRTFIFSGKAAPSYLLAKKVIKLVNALAAVINNDPAINGRMKVIFLENYGVTLAEMIIPASDVSEQISTASKEASGTGNMKFMMNGAVTVGTLDGANIEIRDAVGDDNIFIFGLKAEEVIEICANDQCNPRYLYQTDPRVRQVTEQLIDGSLPGGPDEFRPLYDYLVHGKGDFFELQDFAAYLDAQARVDARFRDRRAWAAMAAVNIARSGQFSSDHTVGEYAVGIWNIRPVPIGE